MCATFGDNILIISVIRSKRAAGHLLVLCSEYFHYVAFRCNIHTVINKFMTSRCFEHAEDCTYMRQTIKTSALPNTVSVTTWPCEFSRSRHYETGHEPKKIT